MPLGKPKATTQGLCNGHVTQRQCVGVVTKWSGNPLTWFQSLTRRKYWTLLALLLAAVVVSTLELLLGSHIYNSDVTMTSRVKGHGRRRPSLMHLNLPAEVDNPEIDCANRDEKWDVGEEEEQEGEEDVVHMDTHMKGHRDLTFELDDESKSRTFVDVDYRISERMYLINTSIRQNNKLNTTAVYDSLDNMMPRYMSAYRNPCWAEQLTADDKYEKNLYNYGKFFRQLEQVWARRLRHGQWWRLRCVPYFYIAGFPKSGTTDLYYKLALHPSIVRGAVKEPHWWTRQRVGKRPDVTELSQKVPFMDYVSLYDNAAECIRVGKRSLRALPANTHLDLITGDGSASTFWDNTLWRELPENAGLSEPRTLVAHYIRHVNPAARFIVIMRNPTERLYSDYLYFRHKNQSLHDFHRKVVISIKKFNLCLANNTIRRCVYDCTKLLMPVRLCVGLYAVYVRDWLGVFPRRQLHVIRSEDYLRDSLATLNAAFTFLGLDRLPAAIASSVAHFPHANTRSRHDKALGPMHTATRRLLENFYEPYNAALAQTLRNNKFLWTDPWTN